LTRSSAQADLPSGLIGSRISQPREAFCRHSFAAHRQDPEIADTVKVRLADPLFPTVSARLGVSAALRRIALRAAKNPEPCGSGFLEKDPAMTYFRTFRHYHRPWQLNGRVRNGNACDLPSMVTGSRGVGGQAGATRLFAKATAKRGE
jgi:hypothetical protein